MNDIAGRLFRGSLWISLSRLFVNGLGILSTFILARLLLPSDFGLVALGTTFLYIITSVTEFSLNAAITRLSDPTDEHLNTAWSINVVRGVALCLLIAALAWPLAAWFNDHRLVPIVIAQGVGLLISSFANPRLVMAQRDLLFRPTFLVSVGQKLGGFVAAILIAVIYHSYWALVAGSIATQLANVLLSYLLMPYRPRISFRHTADLLGFSGWLSIGWTVSTLNWRLDELVIGKLLGGLQLGYYSMSSNLAMMPTREVTAPLTSPIYPAFAALQHDRPRLCAAYQRSQALVAALAMPAGVGVAIIADPLVRLTLGAKWLPTVGILNALAFIFAIQVLGSLCQPLAMAVGDTRRLFVRDVQLLAAAVPMICAGAFWGGLQGVVLARVAVGVVTIFANMALVTDLIGLRIKSQIAANARALASIVAMTAVGFGMQQLIGRPGNNVALIWDIGASVIVCAGVYVGCNTLLWIAMRRPGGPEAEVLRIASSVFSGLRRQHNIA